MPKILLQLAFNLLIISGVFAQNRRYLEDVGSPYASIQIGNAIGNYASVLKNDKAPRTSGGVVVGYLANPYGNKRPSTVFVGGELGIQFDGNENLNVLATNGGDFKANYYQYWLNGVARYRPILSSTRFNPFLDVFTGYRSIVMAVNEQLGDEETERLYTKRKGGLNYGLGIGTGIKLFGQLKNAYLDVAIYYQQSDAGRLVRRNSVYVDNKYDAQFTTVLVKPNQFNIRVGLTGFLSK